MMLRVGIKGRAHADQQNEQDGEEEKTLAVGGGEKKLRGNN